MGSPIQIPKQGSRVGLSTNVTNSFGFLTNATVVDPANEGATVQSTSASDAAGGIGIQQVRVRYFDSSWVLNDEFVTLNGLTPVTMVAANIIRIESFEVFQAGASTTAIGTVTLTSIGGAKLFAQIDPVSTQFVQAVHTVSPGQVCEITDLIVNCSTAAGIEFIIFTEVDNTASGGGVVFSGVFAFILASNSVTMSLTQPIKCDATNSTQGLRIGIAVKGMSALTPQTGTGSFNYFEHM